MPFREENYKQSCFACSELTTTRCELCSAPACDEHYTGEHCLDCQATLVDRLRRKNLTLADLRFRVPPPQHANLAELNAWNAHTDRVYRAHFVLSQLRRDRACKKVCSTAR